MTCKLCEEKLLEHLYGELGEKDAAVMEEHLRASVACRRAYESFQSVLEAVSGAEESDPPLQCTAASWASQRNPSRKSSPSGR